MQYFLASLFTSSHFNCHIELRKTIHIVSNMKPLGQTVSYKQEYLDLNFSTNYRCKYC